jgi:hypothetical protein
MRLPKECMAKPSTKRPFKHPRTLPKRRGLYVRDWRGTDVLPEHDRRLTMDLWMPVPAGDSLWPGVWYVWPGWNEASEGRLPWREATRAEKATFLNDNLGAKAAL